MNRQYRWTSSLAVLALVLAALAVIVAITTARAARSPARPAGLGQSAPQAAGPYAALTDESGRTRARVGTTADGLVLSIDDGTGESRLTVRMYVEEGETRVGIMGVDGVEPNRTMTEVDLRLRELVESLGGASYDEPSAP